MWLMEFEFCPDLLTLLRCRVWKLYPQQQNKYFFRYNVNSDSWTRLDANLTFPNPNFDAQYVAGIILDDSICWGHLTLFIQFDGFLEQYRGRRVGQGCQETFFGIVIAVLCVNFFFNSVTSLYHLVLLFPLNQYRAFQLLSVVNIITCVIKWWWATFLS